MRGIEEQDAILRQEAYRPVDADPISEATTTLVRSLLRVDLLQRGEIEAVLYANWSPPIERSVGGVVFRSIRGTPRSADTALESVEYTVRVRKSAGSFPDRATLVLALKPTFCYEGAALEWGLRPDHSVELVSRPTEHPTVYGADIDGKTIYLTKGRSRECVERIEIRYPEELAYTLNTITTSARCPSARCSRGFGGGGRERLICPCERGC
jgi:hypothetical protein